MSCTAPINMSLRIKTYNLHKLCENKDEDQLYSNCTADQRLCFHYTDSTYHLLVKAETFFCDCTACFVLGLVETANCCFLVQWLNNYYLLDLSISHTHSAIKIASFVPYNGRDPHCPYRIYTHRSEHYSPEHYC